VKREGFCSQMEISVGRARMGNQIGRPWKRCTTKWVLLSVRDGQLEKTNDDGKSVCRREVCPSRMQRASCSTLCDGGSFLSVIS
jgi:hypothetical protein